MSLSTAQRLLVEQTLADLAALAAADSLQDSEHWHAAFAKVNTQQLQKLAKLPPTVRLTLLENGLTAKLAAAQAAGLRYLTPFLPFVACVTDHAAAAPSTVAADRLSEGLMKFHADAIQDWTPSLQGQGFTEEHLAVSRKQTLCPGMTVPCCVRYLAIHDGSQVQLF